jgi:hypothetical protein
MMWSKLITLRNLRSYNGGKGSIDHASIFHNRGRYLFSSVLDPEPDMFLGLLDPDP